MGQTDPVGKVIRKAERKVADRIVEKTAEGIFNKIFGSDSTKTTKDKSVKTDSTVTADSEPFGGLFSAKKVDREYHFDLTLDMVIKTEDKKGKGDPINMKMHYSQDSAYIGTEMESAINIMDFTNMKNYTIVGGNVTSLDLQKVMDKANRQQDKKEEEVDYTFEKTGRKENIAGYLCEEYKVESDDMIGNYWLANDVGIDVETYQKSFATNPNINFPSDARGVILKMRMEDKKDKTVTTMETNEVIKQEIIYDLSKYKVTDLSRFGF
ncbi:DUF4412 domain-containing protein [Portibacter marinus]|uniref:DUF4412 domain-containing protein n=1 Tax=Portibacter marinus TaxID=2898660 RepID=UPI001F22658D|nr:DUF4412 domain-containing protein [Portibacter marinus]